VTPNDIIAALLDVASAAFAVQHGAPDTGNDDMARLRAKLFVLDRLPQPANQPPLTPSAKARHYMMEFLGGRPVEIDSKAFSAAFWLSGLGEPIPQIQAVTIPDPIPRGFGDPTDAEINEITQFNLGKWPSFEAQSWACKVVHAVAEKLREKDIAAMRDKLLADTANEAHKIWNDADLLASLRRLCGYVENGSSESIGISQDDATGEWVLRIGPSMSPRVRHFHARSFHQVIRLAADDMLENERCKFCGFEVEFPCDEPPPDICSAAIRAAEKQKRATPSIAAMKPAGPSPEYLAREAMNKLLLELATTYSNRTAKRIILDVGGAPKMKDIPDDKVQAVTIAARDRLAFERRVAELKAAGDTAGLESLLRGTQGKTAGSPETAARQVEIQDRLHRVVAITREEFGMPAPQFPMTIMDPMRLAGIDTSGTREVELPQDDQVQGQGGTFDGGGASGDFQ
jgi:hypothetical protein